MQPVLEPCSVPPGAVSDAPYGAVPGAPLSGAPYGAVRGRYAFCMFSGRGSRHHRGIRGKASGNQILCLPWVVPLLIVEWSY